MASYEGPGVSNPIYDVSQSFVAEIVNENEEEALQEPRVRTESTGSMLCILSVKSDELNTKIQDDTDHAILIDDRRKPSKDDAIIDLNIDSKALHFVSSFLLLTLQRIPRHLSSRMKTVLTVCQCLVVVGMILAYAYDMGAFPGANTLSINHLDNTVTTAKNFISNAKFPLLYVVGIYYFRTRHLEGMLSDVKLTNRYWNYGRKVVMFMTSMVFLFSVLIPTICITAAQMLITTKANPDERYLLPTIILNCLLSLVVRTMALSIVFAFNLIVYLIYCRIRLFKAQIEKWPVACKNHARNTYVDICRQIRNAERAFQPFLIVHVTILLMLLIPVTISCVEQFEAQGSYTQSISNSPSASGNKPIKIDPVVLIVANQTTPRRDWRKPGQVEQISNGNKTKKSPMDDFNKKIKTHDERHADVGGIIKVVLMVLAEILEIAWVYILPIILIGKGDKCINAIRDAVRMLKFEEQKRNSYMFQTPEDMNVWDSDLQDVRGIQLMGFNLASFKAALLTLLLPFVTTMFRLMLRQVNISP